MPTERPPFAISLSIAVLNLLAFAEWPYGYYQFLRISVTIYTAWLAYWHIQNASRPLAWTFVFATVLYNPIFKIHMERDVHEAINIILAAFVLIEASWSNRRK